MSGPEPTLGGAGGDEVVVVPWSRILRSRMRPDTASQWWVLVSVLTGLLSVNAVFTIIAVALPRIADELDTTTATMTWAITGPLLAFGVAAPILGKAGDIYGHRRLYLLGLGGSAAGAALSALAPSAGWLIAARVLAAVFGAASGAATMALIFAAFAPEDRVKAMGWWSLVGAGGPVLGVALGGPVVESFGWRWVFAAQLPLVAVAVVVGLAVLPVGERASGSRRRLDWGGAGTLTVAVTALLLGVNRGPVWGWSDGRTLAAFALAPLAAAAFVVVERRAPHPLVPLDWFGRRNFAFPVAAVVCCNFAYMGGFILAPLLLAGPLYGYGETRIGLLVMARPLAFSLSAPPAGYLAVRLGERRTAVAGVAAVVVSMLAFTAVGDHRLLPVLVGLVLSGIGIGVAFPSLTASVANAVEEADFGIASAAQQLLSQVGIVSGIQVMQSVQASRAGHGLASSFSDAYLLGAAVAALGVVCAVFLRSATR